jgi:hypothetical protein
MRAGWVIAAVSALGLGGCVDTVNLTPANARAQAIGTPVFHFARGMPGGIMKVTMPDGESLPGSYTVSENAASLTRAGGPGNFQATARGPRTALTCHGDMIAGHGNAECQTQDGAVYHLPL